MVTAQCMRFINVIVVSRVIITDIRGFVMWSCPIKFSEWIIGMTDFVRMELWVRMSRLVPLWYSVSENYMERSIV